MRHCSSMFSVFWQIFPCSICSLRCIPCRLVYIVCGRLFILYSADLADIAVKHITFTLSSMTRAALSALCPRPHESLLDWSNCIADINHWMSANRLKLNTIKLCARHHNMSPPCPVCRTLRPSSSPCAPDAWPAAPSVPCFQ